MRSNTSIHRRELVLGTLAAALAMPARSQQKVVKILVGFPAGQATDIIARILADRLGQVTGGTYIVDNKPGQGGSIAMAQLAKSPNDGSTMMLTHMSAVATNPHLYKRVGYNSLTDYAPVGLLGDLPFILVCNPGMPFKTVKELVAYAKANPDKLTHSSSGNGTVSHLAMEEFKRRAGISITHVPYKGSSAGVADVVAGNVSMALETVSSTQAFLQDGRLRPLAAGTSKRLPTFPNVPTLAEEGFSGINAVTWLMLLYPAGTSATLVQSMHADMNKAMQTPDVEQRMITAGCIPRFSSSGDEALAYVRTEFANWGDVVKRSGVTLD